MCPIIIPELTYQTLSSLQVEFISLAIFNNCVCRTTAGVCLCAAVRPLYLLEAEDQVLVIMDHLQTTLLTQRGFCNVRCCG